MIRGGIKSIIQVMVFIFLCFVVSCSSGEYTGIEIKEFPEEFKQYDRYPWEMLQLEKFSEAYNGILEKFPRKNYMDDFIFQLGVVSSGNRFVYTEQGSFVFIYGCKPHFCLTAQTFVLYDPDNQMVWAYISGLDIHSSADFNIWLGSPDPKKKKLIKHLIDLVWYTRTRGD